MKKPNLNNFGKKLKFKQRSSKKVPEITEKELFIETMDMFAEVWTRSNVSYDKHKINLLEYDEMFYQIIEGFTLLKYGLWKTEIILWYVFARLDENDKVISLTYKVKEEEEEEIVLNNPSDLWDFLKKIEENDPDIK